MKALRGRPRPGVRPTTQKVLEALLQIVEHRRSTLEGARVLELCAGTGQLGRACAERGAARVVFVERNPRVAADLRRAAPDAEVRAADAVAYLERSDERFDLVFLDPPYGSDVGPRALAVLARRGRLAEGGVAVVEHHHKDPLPERAGTLRLARRERYGETALSFYEEDSA